jgi:acetyl-CoA carboxylase carboxyl transferase subunit beta
MNDLTKRLKKIEQRISYLIHIKNTGSWGNLSGFQADCETLKKSIYDMDRESLPTSWKSLKTASPSWRNGARKA